MKITAVEKAKGGRYTVYVDDEYWYILDTEIIFQNSLKAGMEVDEDFLEDVRYQAERRKARERAYYLLEYRDHSRKELRDKLLKSARAEIVDEILSMLEEQGLLDDEKYAEKVVRHCLKAKCWGRRRAYAELLHRGIAADIAQNALDDCEIDTAEQVKTVIDKKYAGRLSDGDYNERQKVIAALLRRGFSYGEIKDALEDYKNE